MTAGVEDLYDQALARMETELITRVLRRTGGNQLEAARILGVTRTTLRTKLRQLGIAIDRVVVGGDEPGQEPLSEADGSNSR